MKKNINNDGIRTREPKQIDIVEHLMWEEEIEENKPLSIDEMDLNESFSDWIERTSDSFSGDDSISLMDLVKAIYHSYCGLKGDYFMLSQLGIKNIANVLDVVEDKDFRFLSLQLNDPDSVDDRLVISESKNGVFACTMNSKIRSDEGRPYEKVKSNVLREYLSTFSKYRGLIELSHGINFEGNPSLEINVDGNTQDLLSDQRVRVTIKNEEAFGSEYCISIAFIVGKFVIFDSQTSFAKYNGKLVRLSPKIYQKAAKEVLIDRESLKRYESVIDLIPKTSNQK